MPLADTGEERTTPLAVGIRLTVRTVHCFSFTASPPTASPPSSAASITTRNPRLALCFHGLFQFRDATRHCRGSLPHDPPRITRDSIGDDAGPGGSSPGEVAKESFSYQSPTHSETFPCMSCTPQSFGVPVPTARGRHPFAVMRAK